jgi:hypothetical protein
MVVRQAPINSYQLKGLTSEAKAILQEYFPYENEEMALEDRIPVDNFDHLFVNPHITYCIDRA